MQKLSTAQVAKRLGTTSATLSRYIKAAKISAPQPTAAGGMRMRLWTEAEVGHLRKLLPKIANGRKTRYKKKGKPTTKKK